MRYLREMDIFLTIPNLKSISRINPGIIPVIKLLIALSLMRTHKCLIDSLLKYEKINKDLKESDLRQRFVNIVSGFPEFKN